MADRTPSSFGRTVWGADDIQRIVTRNADWLAKFIAQGAMSVMKDGRPLFTKQTTEAAQLAALLTAPPQFWDAYKKQDPEGAYAAAASIVRAREKGKIPAEGPLADQVPPEELTDGELPNDSAGNVGKPGTGTEMDQRLPMFTRRPTDLTT